MNLELEKKIIGSYLTDSHLFNLHPASETWFHDYKHKEIIKAMHILKGRFSDVSELLAAIKQENPKTLVTETNLEMLSFDSTYAKDFRTAMSVLEHDYLENRVIQATLKYNENPTEKNKQLVKDRIREQEEQETPYDKGDIKPVAEEFVWELHNEKEDDSVKTFERLDKMLGGGMTGGMLVTIGARPGIGKTAFGVNMAIKALEQNENIQIDFMTFEMTKKQMLSRFLARLGDINSMKFRNPHRYLKSDEKQTVEKNLNDIKLTGLRIHDKLRSINEVSKQIRRRHYAAEGKPYICFIDYLGLVQPTNDNQPRHVQVAEITRELKLLTNELNIPVVLFSQLNRGIEGRQDKTPNLSDLRESGAVEQDSNVVAFLYEDKEDDSIVNLGVAKNREGMVGKIEYSFIKSKMYFEELERE
ncbi:DnaB-like helicase C-terminal domain-containing protein [Marinilactibacillus psychrotolerans]|uniref:DnaB-like helicase C-terminal domain-containing protein n=1 Tax=Marinilactibacillus psychrotolerans TaxID=191770 RepID=UPI003883F095